MSATNVSALLIIGIPLSHSLESNWWPYIDPILPTEPGPDFCTYRNPKR